MAMARDHTHTYMCSALCTHVHSRQMHTQTPIIRTCYTSLSVHRTGNGDGGCFLRQQGSQFPFLALGMGPRALHMLSARSTAKLYPSCGSRGFRELLNKRAPKHLLGKERPSLINFQSSL